MTAKINSCLRKVRAIEYLHQNWLEDENRPAGPRNQMAPLLFNRHFVTTQSCGNEKYYIAYMLDLKVKKPH